MGLANKGLSPLIVHHRLLKNKAKKQQQPITNQQNIITGKAIQIPNEVEESKPLPKSSSRAKLITPVKISIEEDDQNPHILAIKKVKALKLKAKLQYQNLMMLLEHQRISKRGHEPLMGRDMMLHREGVLRLERELERTTT